MRHVWTEAERDVLRARYADEPTAEIARSLGLPVSKVYQQAAKLGLQKSDAFWNGPYCGGFRPGKPTGGEAFRFQKGIIPHNKGVRRPGWSAGRMKETQFKKGERRGAAHSNWRPIGTIAVDTEGYLRIKVREAAHGVEATGFGNTKVWPLLHRHVWEQAHGPIPPSHIVTFKDGNRSNCALENLELMSRRDNARRNQMWNSLPRELAETIQLVGALKRKIRRIRGEKHD